MKLFGDDGFRDRYGSKLMSKKFLQNFFYNLNFFFKDQRIDKICIGYDTRKSNKDILNIILKNLLHPKKIYLFKDPVTTPCIHYMSKVDKTFNIMITASHFSSNYNGFKFFFKGKKLTKKMEKKIEFNLKNKKKFAGNKPKVSQIKYKPYVNFINRAFKIKVNKKILVDFSNGSAALSIGKIKFLDKVSKVNFRFNGENINKRCGSNYLKENCKKKFKNYDYCFAFDGDADRILISEKKYGIIESEQIALIFLKYLEKIKNQDKKSIVTTEISNPWLYEQLKKDKYKVYLTKVGDRNVIEKQIAKKSILGFETSGHFSFHDRMDGMYTMGFFLKILEKNEEIIKNVLKKKPIYKLRIFRLRNISKKMSNIISKIKKKEKIKIIQRKSIWTGDNKIYFFLKRGKATNLQKRLNNIFRYI